MKTDENSLPSLSILLITFLLLINPIAAFSQSCEELLKNERFETEENPIQTRVFQWGDENGVNCNQIREEKTNNVSTPYVWWTMCNQREYLFYDGLPPHAVKDNSGRWWSIDIVNKLGRPTVSNGHIQSTCMVDPRDDKNYLGRVQTTYYGKVRINKDEGKPMYLPHTLKFDFYRYFDHKIIKADF